MTFNTTLAYIDPGTGALLSQMVVAAAVGCLFYMRKTRDFIVSKTCRLFGVKPKPDPAKAKLQPVENSLRALQSSDGRSDRRI
jgi:hypothetical protein